MCTLPAPPPHSAKHTHTQTRQHIATARATFRLAFNLLSHYFAVCWLIIVNLAKNRHLELGFASIEFRFRAAPLLLLLLLVFFKPYHVFSCCCHCCCRLLCCCCSWVMRICLLQIRHKQTLRDVYQSSLSSSRNCLPGCLLASIMQHTLPQPAN